MKENDFLDGISNIGSDVVERFVSMDNRLQKKAHKSKTKSIWLRFGAIAACFLLIVSAVIVVPMLKEDDPRRDDPNIEPYTPSGEPWSPLISPTVSDIVLSAKEAGGVFKVMDGSNGTNQYQKIYAPAPEYLNLIPLPAADYLPLYSSGHLALSENELQNFIDKYLDAATTFFGIHSKAYEIERNETWDGKIYYEAEIRESDGEKDIYLYFVLKNNLLYFSRSNLGERRLKINGSMISIMESDTDEQIKEKLKDAISSVCTSFGRNYSDIRIYRDYRDDQLKTIQIYLYSAEETIFPSNFSESPMTSDYISLTFYTDWGSGTFCSWGGSKEEAFLSNVSLYETVQNWNEYYSVEAKSKMLTLEEAEKLLEKGYVFGGHTCPLCMALQPEVDFSDYTCVDIEYIFNENEERWIPFYAFYKYIGKNGYGINTYAKTYVPAVQVSGYEEYFESQKANHRSGFEFTVD